MLWPQGLTTGVGRSKTGDWYPARKQRQPCSNGVRQNPELMYWTFDSVRITLMNLTLMLA